MGDHYGDRLSEKENARSDRRSASLQNRQKPIDRGPGEHGDRGGVGSVDALDEEKRLDREHADRWKLLTLLSLKA